MPLLEPDHAAELRQLAKHGRACEQCGSIVVNDYCRTCDEFYWFGHAVDCAQGQNERRHWGHRKTIIPFVEER